MSSGSPARSRCRCARCSTRRGPTRAGTSATEAAPHPSAGRLQLRRVMTPQARLNGRPGVPQPWGWEMLWTLTPRYASKVLFIRRGHEIALQVHREKEESFLLRSGRLIFVVEDRGGDLREVWLDP